MPSLPCQKKWNCLQNWDKISFVGTFGGALRRLLDYEQLIPYLESFSTTKTYFRVLNIRCLSKCQYCFYSSKWIFHFSLLFSCCNFPCDQKSDQPVAATCCWCKTTKQQKQCEVHTVLTSIPKCI